MNTTKQTFAAPLQSSHACDRINATEGWLICPACRKQKLARIMPTTRVIDLALHCKKCNREVVVNISTEPEP